MRGKEVRIGNLIYSRLIGSDRKKVVGVDIDVMKNIIEGTTYFDYKPIPLTKEILLNAGFNTRTTAGHSVDYFIGENPITHDWLFHICWLERNECPFYKNGHFLIHYVHQLQNLYRFLCGEELEINLTQEGQKL